MASRATSPPGQVFHTNVVQVAHEALPCGTLIRIEDTDSLALGRSRSHRPRAVHHRPHRGPELGRLPPTGAIGAGLAARARLPARQVSHLGIVPGDAARGWPSSNEVNAAVAAQLTGLLDEHGGPVAEVTGQDHATARVSFGAAAFVHQCPRRRRLPGCWRRLALGTLAGGWHQCMMAAADLFDDVADGDQAGELADPGLSRLPRASSVWPARPWLASSKTVRRRQPRWRWRRPTGTQFAQAANGQATNLHPASRAGRCRPFVRRPRRAARSAR